MNQNGTEKQDLKPHPGAGSPSAVRREMGSPVSASSSRATVQHQPDPTATIKHEYGKKIVKTNAT